MKGLSSESRRDMARCLEAGHPSRRVTTLSCARAARSSARWGEARFIRYERTILTLNRCDRLACAHAAARRNAHTLVLIARGTCLARTHMCAWAMCQAMQGRPSAHGAQMCRAYRPAPGHHRPTRDAPPCVGRRSRQPGLGRGRAQAPIGFPRRRLAPYPAVASWTRHVVSRPPAILTLSPPYGSMRCRAPSSPA